MNANNTIMIHGRLVRDPEMKTGASGAEFCRFTVAVDKYNGKERSTDFFDCTAFGKTASAICQFMKKGKEIIVVGSMESSTSEKDGQKRTYWGVKADTFGFCGSKGDSAPSAPAEPQPVDPPEELPF